MTPDQKKAHEEMMEVLREIEFWIKRIARKMEADKLDVNQEELEKKVGLK